MIILVAESPENQVLTFVHLPSWKKCAVVKTAGRLLHLEWWYTLQRDVMWVFGTFLLNFFLAFLCVSALSSMNMICMPLKPSLKQLMKDT